MTAWLLAPLVLPLVLACALYTRARRPAIALLPLSALPLASIALAGDARLELPTLLLGSHLVVDALTRTFALLAGALWLVAGAYGLRYMVGDASARRFWLFWLLTQTGVSLAVLAADAVTFYLGFSAMTFAAYGLVVHDGSEASRRAGRVYIVLALLGEALALSGVLALTGRLGATPLAGAAGPMLAASPWIAALLALGFAVKVGAIPLHLWLPLAHPCAPTPASALLSGVLVKLGLLAWLRFLPLGESDAAPLGDALVAVGLLGAFYGAAVGIAQSRPKTVLAYSTVSQMGLATVLVGLALRRPEAEPLVLAAAGVFVLHHGFAKAALFLGVGVVAEAMPRRRVGRTLARAALVLPALALAGAPGTGGAVVKGLIKSAGGAPRRPGSLPR